VEFEWYGLIELFVVLTFVMAWGAVELYTLRLDKRAAAEAEKNKTKSPDDNS
jgi:uncharacterized membrane protein